MDLVDIISEKRFLGQEFLTWLWFKSDQRGGTVLLPDRGDVQVVFEKHMLLEYGEGEAHEKLICRGLQTELQEARIGLLMGKKLEQARIRLAHGDYEWYLTLTASLFEFRSTKVPKTLSEGEENDDSLAFEGKILERVGMIEEVTRIMDELFAMFLELRCGPGWDEELINLRKWVHSAAAQ